MEEVLPRKCWKCGKVLDNSNTSPIVYTSDPPKYACTTCDGGFTELTKKEKPIEYKSTTEIRLSRSKGDLTVSDLVEIGAL